MALVIKPRNEREEIYLKAVMEELRKYKIKSAKLYEDISAQQGNIAITLPKGAYIIPYKNPRPELIEKIGIELQKKGFKVYSLDPLTLALFLYLIKD